MVNTGKALETLGSAYLNIMWPYELANEKWLLYPASMTFEDHPDTHCTLSAALNPLKLSSTSPARRPLAFNHTVRTESFSQLQRLIRLELTPVASDRLKVLTCFLRSGEHVAHMLRRKVR